MSTTKKSPKTLSTQQFLWQLIRPYRWQLLGGSVMLVVSAAAMLALPQYLKHMFDTALRTGDTSKLAVLAIFMFGTVLIMVASIFIRTRLIQFSSTAIMISLLGKLSANLLQQDVNYFESRSAGEIVSRHTLDTAVLREFLNLSAPQLIRGIFLGVGTIIALLYTSPSLTCLLLLAGLPIAIIGKIIGKKIRINSRKQQDNAAVYAGAIEEAVTNIRTILVFSQHNRFQQAFHAQTDKMHRMSNNLAVMRSAFVAINVIIGFTALIAVVWLGGLRVMQGTMSLGDMMAFLLYLAFLADAASNVTNFWPVWQSTIGATERIIAMLHQKPTITSPKSPKSLKPATTGRAITITNLTYNYPTRPDTPALSNLSLTIPAGTNVAIVGPSGSGKSTLFRLLLRLDDPTTGTIKLDGTDLKSLALNDLRAQYALVAQESPLFTGTIAHNVTFAKPDATETDIWAALKAANAEAFVKTLPKGLNTQVGEKGVQLSGGQKQRLAIARAILADAPILLLDEATAHLDSESEAAIQKALEGLTKTKTTLTIAHRLSTVKAADLILVLNHGVIEAQGTHAQLLKSSKLYNALATLQLQS